MFIVTSILIWGKLTTFLLVILGYGKCPCHYPMLSHNLHDIFRFFLITIIILETSSILCNLSLTVFIILALYVKNDCTTI